MTSPDADPDAAARAAIYHRIKDRERADRAAKRAGDALLKMVLTAAILRPGTLPGDILAGARGMIDMETRDEH